jgi:hypothetical protein
MIYSSSHPQITQIFCGICGWPFSCDIFSALASTLQKDL